jgi:hypothetical protein
MMSILQFRVGCEYDYNVTFETGLEKQRIQTNDRPTGDLLSAVSSVVVAAIKFFRFENITAQFRQITFGYPEKGPESFVLEFTIKTKENVYIKHILKTKKLSLSIEDATSTDVAYQTRIEQNNSLVEKVINLREEIVAYIQGARAQNDLLFEDGNDDENSDSEGSLFDDDKDEDELDIVAGNISQFEQAGKK